MPDSAPFPAAPPVRLYLVHETRRRARLRVADPVDRETLIDLANGLATVAGIDRVLARPATGSLIVETEAPAGAVLATMETAGLVAFVQPAKAPPVRQTLQLGLAKADHDLQTQTEGALDLRTTLGLMFLALAIVQFSRGHIAGPATTLAAAALSMFDAPSGKR